MLRVIADACRSLGLPESAADVAAVDACITGRVPAALLARCTPSQWMPLVAAAAQKLGWCTVDAAAAVLEASPNVGCGRPMTWAVPRARSAQRLHAI